MSDRHVATAGEFVFPMAGLIWQEYVLQAYRIQLLVSQPALMLPAAALISLDATATESLGTTFSNALVLVIASIGLTTLFVLARAIGHRAESVDWWQRRILSAERDRERLGHMSEYRVCKNNGFQDSHNVEQLTADQVASLMRVRQPRMRQIYLVMYIGFGLLWIALIVPAAETLMLGS